MLFDDRIDAGRQLAAKLSEYQGKDVVVLALPRGGVPVAEQVADRLGAPLDLLLVRKIGVPWQPELAMGAVIDGSKPVIVRNEDVIRIARVSEDDFEATARSELKEIERRKQRYIGGRASVDVAGRTAIVVDDGVATGATVRAAIRGLRKREPAKIVLAVPVAAPDAAEALAQEVDDVVCLHAPAGFRAIGQFYRQFDQLSDDEVIGILATHPVPRSATGAGSEE
ncbi:phosphoribosyltransferase [Roseibium salinum]|uniref:Phosphoribosyltransferase n=1 Tax=Roseibium salinum TaxID=1604349 RepID=A0ABT3QX25_9HYPH|nr:phosphoribosyltransferase [Roseibium sp. DSM 29163]MCX2721489.1 phosphoribosyltransferase [Roseibium sp. DSM 29163]